QNALAALAGGPRRAVLGRIAIGIVPAILHPLGNVARRVVEPEAVWTEGACWHSPPRRRRTAILTICVVGARIAAPGKIRGRACTRRVFPLGFSRQAIAFPGLLGEPSHESLCIIPADVEHWPLASSPTAIVRAVLATSA